MAEDHKPVTARPIGNIYCGTCSWTDRTLIESGGFYAAGIRSPEARLRYYAQVFPIVEVDSTYYALPSEQNARLWAERTPPGFVFNIKAFGLLTRHGAISCRNRSWIVPLNSLHTAPCYLVRNM